MSPITGADPLAAYTVGRVMLECALERVSATEAGPPGRACVITGAVSWDDCECGQLTVGILSRSPSNQFPFPADQATLDRPAGQSRCGSPLLVVTYAVTMLRCSPSGGENGEPPPCEDLDIAAQITVIDADAVLKGVFCCLGDMYREGQIHEFTTGTQILLTPDGMCQGSELTVILGLQSGCLCPREDS